MKHLIFLLSGFFFLTATLYAQAPPSEEAAQKVVKLSADAAVAYDKGEYEKALSLYNQAHQLWANPKITFAIVKCYEALKRYKEALEAAERGLRENPPAVLKARFDSKVAFLKTALAKGQLNLLITPSGATVKIDGKEVGKAPLRPLSLDVGEHQLEISHPNHAKIVQGITITGGSELRLNFTLQPVTGRLSVTSTPSGADVEIDGRPWGKTPLNDLSLPVGSHSITVKYQGYQTVNRQVNISPEQSESISVLLSEGSGGSAPQGERLWYKSWPGWTLLGLGLAAGAVGAVFLVGSANTHQSVRDRAANPASHEFSQKELQDQWNRANTEQRIGIGLASAGGGLLVLSIILFVTKAGSPIEKPAATSTTLLQLPSSQPPLASPPSRATLLYQTP